MRATPSRHRSRGPLGAVVWPVLLVGCGLVGACQANEGPTLSRLVEAWGDEVVVRAAPMTTASLMLARLSTELCVAEGDGTWAGVELGTEPPLSFPLEVALGSPTVNSLKLKEGSLAEATLSGVHIGGREDVRLQLSASVSENAEYAVSILALDPADADEAGGEVEAFGRTAWRVQAGCESTAALVAGTARWVDEEQRSHSVDLPADSDLSSGMRFSRKLTYVPSSGSLSWQGRLNGQEVSLTTDDAEGLDYIEASGDTGGTGEQAVPQWQALARGADWSATTWLPIDPEL